MTDETVPIADTEHGWTWCRDPAMAEAIGVFFAAHAGDAYISHSELQSGRAEAPGRWHPGIAARIAVEARAAMAGEGADGGVRCALAQGPGGIAGLGFVRFVPEAARPYAVIEDMIVDPTLRGRGLGGRLLTWVGEEARACGCSRVFLESGLHNHAAHGFFERQGFAQTSIVMMRDLCAS